MVTWIEFKCMLGIHDFIDGSIHPMHTTRFGSVRKCKRCNCIQHWITFDSSISGKDMSGFHKTKHKEDIKYINEFAEWDN